MATRPRLCIKTKERRSFSPQIRQMLTFLAMTAIELHDTPISAAAEKTILTIEHPTTLKNSSGDKSYSKSPAKHFKQNPILAVI